MFKRLFVDHPASVGESYVEHLVSALGFACSMFLGAIACFVHALCPWLFKSTGSAIIARLHALMITNRSRIR